MNKSDLVSNLQHCIISYSSNPDPNTLVEDIMNRSFEMINNYLFDTDRLHISMGEKGLVVDDYYLPREESEKAFINSFQNFLNETKIQGIEICREITLREYILFISLMAKPPDFFRNIEKVRSYITEKSLKNIDIHFLKPQEEVLLKKGKKAVILAEDIPDYEEDSNTSQEVFSAAETTAVRTVRPVAPDTKASPPFIVKFESIIKHVRSNIEDPAQKHRIISNMVQNLSPESILELINEFYKRGEDLKNKNHIYPYIDYDKFIIIASHILMVINDELNREKPEMINLNYCERLRDVLKDIASQPHLSKSMKLQAKCRTAEILIFNEIQPDEPILSRSGILKGRINVGGIVELIYQLDMELGILDHKGISDAILDELLDKLDNSREDIVQEGFKRILKGLLDISIDNAFNYFTSIINALFKKIKDRKNLSPLYNFACETAVYYSPLLIKRGNMALLRDMLKVLNKHRDTRPERSAEQWYKARLTINSIGQCQAVKEMIASFFWMDESRRSELLSTLLLIKETAVKYLLNLLSESKDIKSRKTLISSLISLGKDSVPEIISELSRKQPWYYTRNLILILGKINTPEASAYIKEFLSHEDKRVRKEAINALVSLKDPSANSYLIPYLSNETEDDPYMIKKIISSLEYSKPENIAFLILRILNDDLYSSRETEEEDIKQACCYVAGRLKIKEAVPVMKKLLLKKSLFGINKGHSDTLRAAALYALHLIGGEDNEIRKHSKDDSPLVRSVVNEILKSL